MPKKIQVEEKIQVEVGEFENKPAAAQSPQKCCVVS